MARPLELEPMRLVGGKWRVNVISAFSPTGKRQQLRFDTKQAALAFIEELKARRDNIAAIDRTLSPSQLLDAASAAGRSSTFIDWSTGGDETVSATAKGNRIQIVAAFRERDALQCVRRVASTLRERQLTNYVSADAGGIGGPMC